MADPTPSAESSLSGRTSNRPPAEDDHGSRLFAADYGTSGSKGMDSALKPLAWLLLPFVFCLAYGILTR